MYGQGTAATSSSLRYYARYEQDWRLPSTWEIIQKDGPIMMLIEYADATIQEGIVMPARTARSLELPLLAQSDERSAWRPAAATRTWTDGIVGAPLLFVYLQALDLLTTLVGFRVGAAEGSPFIRTLMHAGPTFGVFASKLVALALGGVCLYTNRRRLIGWLNYWSAALVLWNLFVILAALGRR
jgi:hypothetical protein